MAQDMTARGYQTTMAVDRGHVASPGYRGRRPGEEEWGARAPPDLKMVALYILYVTAGLVVVQIILHYIHYVPRLCRRMCPGINKNRELKKKLKKQGLEGVYFVSPEENGKPGNEVFHSWTSKFDKAATCSCSNSTLPKWRLYWNSDHGKVRPTAPGASSACDLHSGIQNDELMRKNLNEAVMEPQKPGPSLVIQSHNYGYNLTKGGNDIDMSTLLPSQSKPDRESKLISPFYLPPTVDLDSVYIEDQSLDINQVDLSLAFPCEPSISTRDAPSTSNARTCLI